MSSMDEVYIKRCFELAQCGLGHVSPNPMVGCVIVHDEKIIGEGWHRKFGNPHAEVEAINSVTDKSLLAQSTLYVNLEPCCHWGKTPPCTDLIIEHKIPKVIIANHDSFEKVNGNGIQKLRDAGVNVVIGILEEEGRFFNRRFFTFNEKKRPYIILKYAQTMDGFMATESGEQKWITNSQSKQWVHQWRTEEDAILVGANTAMLDNPELTVREVKGRSPIRIVIDKEGKLPENRNLFDGKAMTFVFNENQKQNKENLKYLKVDFSENVIDKVLAELYNSGIQSLIVEGGAKTLNSFISVNKWDEARVFTSNEKWGRGVAAPILSANKIQETDISGDTLKIFLNHIL